MEYFLLNPRAEYSHVEKNRPFKSLKKKNYLSLEVTTLFPNSFLPFPFFHRLSIRFTNIHYYLIGKIVSILKSILKMHCSV